MKPTFWLLFSAFIFIGCSPYRQIGKTAQQTVIQNKALQTAHVGISIYEPATGKYWYNHQGDKYFVPASNTKIPTAYVGMKYLGDSLPGLLFHDTDTALYIQPTADPTLLHRDYKTHPVFDFLKGTQKPVYYFLPAWQTREYGAGWSWSDYNESYMPERSELPIYGNVLELKLEQNGSRLELKPDIHFFRYSINELADPLTQNIRVVRRQAKNTFDVNYGRQPYTTSQFPFMTFENPRLLEDTLKMEWRERVRLPQPLPFKTVYSQPTDSMLKPLMHRSDNFFAEQTLLMVSNKLLGVMNEGRIIDTVLKGDFKDLPQMPRWADGSGLSRYNLFTPQSFVAILHKMKAEFGMERLKEIFPAGNDGTLRNYYVSNDAYIWAKTGTLSGVVALSGYLITKKEKLLLFSVLVNNHRANATDVRRAVEQFLLSVREKY